MSAPDLSVYDNDPTLYLVTSLTAGSSHIITATSRMETILRANKIPFVGVDTATDDRMRSLWSRRARGKKFPGLVREGFLIGDLDQIEDWNEYGELHENIPPIGAATPAAPAAAPKTAPAEPPVSIPTNAKQKVENKPPAPAASGPPQTLAMRQMVQEAAAKAKDFKGGKDKEKEKEKEKEDKTPVTPIKLGRIDHSKPKLPPSDLRSPKSIPIPASPALKSPVSPTSESGVGMSIAERAANPTQTHRGSSVSVASQEDIKKVEEEQKIVEEDEEDEEDEDSSEEDDDDGSEDEDEDESKAKIKDDDKAKVNVKPDEEDDDDDDDEDDEDEDDEDEDDEDEDSPEEPSEDEPAKPASKTTPVATTTTNKPSSTTTQAEAPATAKAAATTSLQPAASGAHAGQSVGD